MSIILLFSYCILVSTAYRFLKHPNNTLNTQKYVIIATNDIHGGAFPTQLIRSDTKQKYTAGGIIYLADMIDTIRKQYGTKNVLYLDGGDQYQGGIQSSNLISNGKIMNQFFNIEGMAAAAIGNHEFDNGPQFLFKYLNNSISPFLAANLYSSKDKDVSKFLPNSKRSTIFKLNNDIKIGVIGLTTKDTPFTSSGFTKHLFPDYQFKDYATIIRQQSKKLKENGSNAIILLAHQASTCPGQSFENKIWKNTTKQIPCPEGQITKLLDQLPQGTIDAIVQGHKHEIAHYYKNNIPIIGTTNGGFYFNLLYLTFDKVKKKIVDTSIQGPIPICEKIFNIQKRCNYIEMKQLKNVGELTHWKFHGKTVTASPRLQKIYDQWIPKMAPYLEELVQNQVYLIGSKKGESQLGNLISDLYIKASKGQADFSLVNPGSFRTIWYPGIIQYQHFYKMFPFSGILQTFSISGSELKKMYKVLQSGKKGFYISSGIKMTVKESPRSLVSITRMNGQQIIDNKQYIGIAESFLLLGGDDMSKVIGNIYTPRNVKTLGYLCQILKPLLKQMRIIQQNTLIDPNNPRLTVV